MNRWFMSAYLLFFCFAPMSFYGKSAVDYNGIIFSKTGIILTPKSIYNGGPLQAATSPQLAGYLDQSFNVTGYAVLNLLGVCKGIALQPDGKIVLGGYTSVAAVNRYSVARLNSDGSLDTTFNNIGAGGSQAGTYVLPTFTGITNSYANALQLQADGKIVLAGYSSVGGVARYSVARLNSDGSLDTTFNSSGAGGTQAGTYVLSRFTGSTNSYANALQLQTDGKIVLAGYSVVGGVNRYSVARLNSDGSLDSTFNNLGAGGTQAGTYMLPIFTGSTGDVVYAMQLQPDNKIVLSGRSVITGVFRYSVARLNSDGSLDSTFNSSSAGGTQQGTYILSRFIGSVGDISYSQQLQVDGKIILAGFSVVGVYRYSVARLNPDGSLDATFNSSGSGGAQPGTYTLPIFPGSTGGFAYAQQLQLDGKILLSGHSSVGGKFRYSVARLNPDGSLDTTFSPSGTGMLLMSGFQPAAVNNEPNCIAIQSNGSILLAGHTNTAYSVCRLTNQYTLADYQMEYSRQGGFY